jgi:UDP-N-acetylmuramate: L-alanyl-gamma-D-glutamyl-meso-diaminopimelate ligase
MHLHIIGICGTFMGGLAMLAQQAGHRVTGCDAQVYPPMSTQLEAQGITLIEGFGVAQLDLNPDLIIVGNVAKRGMPIIEAMLNRGLPYTSGPQWLGDNILRDKWVIAVAGTHGKTTTSSMVAWILAQTGYQPSFLIGGIPQGFGCSAQLTDSNFFVIEADEYDTAFFDKRSKFVHYHPKTLILNNLEYDHADIFPDVAAIETQFHHVIRTVPEIGQVIVNHRYPALHRVMARGCWSDVQILHHENAQIGWQITPTGEVTHDGQSCALLNLPMLGEYNRHNALAAMAAARHVGVAPADAVAALVQFTGVKRRMEVRGVVNDITVYDDFAHHPTAIAASIAGLKQSIKQSIRQTLSDQQSSGRILAVLEPRSNTMKAGVMKDALPASLQEADAVLCYAAGLSWDAQAVLAELGDRLWVTSELSELVTEIVAQARAGDAILVMSNGGFGGIHQQIVAQLQAKYPQSSLSLAECTR